MSNLAWLLTLTGILALLGSATLIFITLKFYWGDRGRPPLSREERRKIREANEKEN